MARENFDYSKCNSNDYEYYGFHLKNGRYHIDTKRLKKLHLESLFSKDLFTAPRNTHYFIPKHKNRSDYAINILKDQLNTLTKDWNEEYKTVISKITTPKEVQDNVRLQEIAYTSCSDDCDEIEMDAFMEGMRREKKYGEVIKSIHLQYLQKIFTEFFRAVLLVIKDRGYENNIDFSFKYLLQYIQKELKVAVDKANPIYSLPHYKYFDILNKIDNFLKHNSVMAYNSLANNPREKDEDLKRFQASFVCSEQEMGHPYENGMYAGDWLKIGPSFVDEILDNLLELSKEFCKLLYDEDDYEACWNSDESLLENLKDYFID